jgi:predicted RNase H-like nuclease (RuvC/YqgF family)
VKAIDRARRRITGQPLEPIPPAPDVLPPDPVTARVDALEAAFNKVFADRERSAEMIAEQNRRIREQDQTIGRFQAEKDAQGELITNLIRQISHIQGQHDALVHETDRSRKEQGQRMGDLEHQVKTLQKEAEQVPPLREQVTKLQLLLNLYHTWGEGIVRLLEEHNLIAPPMPMIDFERIAATSARLAQVEGETG